MNGPDNAELIRQLGKLHKVAIRGELDYAAAWLGRHLAEIRKTERERPWPLGRCMGCWADHNRLREAIAHAPGGGFPFCGEHLDEFYPSTSAAA